jgi:hypothetical protein
MAARNGKRGSRPRWVLDSGGLTSLLGHSIEARGRLRYIVTTRQVVQIPAAILVECTTGDAGRDAEANRVLAKLSRLAGGIEVADEERARQAGRLRFRARTDDGIDALVAACAVGDGSPCVVLTSDPRDLERLLARERHVIVRRV